MKSTNTFIVHGWMLNELNLKGNSLMVFAIIFGFSQDGFSRYYGGQKFLCSMTGATKNTVLKSIDELIESQLIVKFYETKNGVTKCEYAQNDEVVQKLVRGGAEIGMGTVPETGITIINNINKIKEKDICIYTDSELPLNIPKKKEEKPTKEESAVNWEMLLAMFNRITSKKTKVISDKAKKQILSLLKSGYSKEDFANAIKNCYEDPYHKEHAHKYLTLEFISRPEKMERFHFVKPANQQREKGAL